LRKYFFFNKYLFYFIFFCIENDLKVFNFNFLSLNREITKVNNALETNEHVYFLLTRKNYYKLLPKKNKYVKNKLLMEINLLNLKFILTRKIDSNYICKNCSNVIILNSYLDVVIKLITIYKGFNLNLNRFNFIECKECGLFKVCINKSEIKSFPDTKKLLMDIILKKQLRGYYLYNNNLYSFFWDPLRNILFKPILLVNLGKSDVKYPFLYFFEKNVNIKLNDLLKKSMTIKLESSYVYDECVHVLYYHNQYLYTASFLKEVHSKYYENKEYRASLIKYYDAKRAYLAAAPEGTFTGTLTPIEFFDKLVRLQRAERRRDFYDEFYLHS